MLYDAVWAVWCCAITVRWIMMDPWLPFAHNSCILLHTAAYCFNVSMSEDFTTFHDFPRLPSWLPSRLVHDYHDFHDFHDLIQFDASRPRRRRRPLEAPTLAQSSSCETSPRRRRSAHRICGEEATTKQRAKRQPAVPCRLRSSRCASCCLRTPGAKVTKASQKVMRSEKFGEVLGAVLLKV